MKHYNPCSHEARRDIRPDPVSPPKPPRPRRRWFQFSLRSLLLIMTVLAVWLGMQMDRVRKRQQALEMVLGHSGSVSNSAALDSHEKRYDANTAEVEYQLARTKGRSAKGTAVSAGEVDRLRVQRLWAQGIFDEGHRPFWCPRWALPDETFVKVTHISLIDRSIDDDDVKSLQVFAELEYLDLRGTRITDLGLRRLACLKNLRHLDLTNTNVTGEGVRKLREALPDCDIIDRMTVE